MRTSALARRRFLALGTGAAAAALLAACASAPPTPTQAPAAAPAKAAAAAPTPAQAAASAPAQAAAPTPAAAAAPAATSVPAAAKPATSAGSAKVAFWHFNGADQAKVLQADADDFAKANAGLSVELLSIPVGEIVQKIQAAVAGKAGPDVVYADLVQVPTYWKAGLLSPLDERIRSDKIDLKDFYDGFLQYAFQDGKYFSIPHEANLQFLTWNKDLFQKSGLDPEKGPKSWEEVVDFAKRTTSTEQKTFGYALPAVNAKDGIGRMAYNMASLLWKLDGQFLKPDGKGRDERGWPAFNNELGEQAWSFWVDLVNKHKAATLSPPANAFQAGLVGMQEFNPPALPGVKAAIGDKFKIGVGLFPAKKKLANFAGGAHLAMMKDTGNPDAAWKLISFMLSPDIQLRWYTATGFVPQRKSMAEHPDYQKWLLSNPEYKLTGEILPFVKPRPPIPLCNELLNKAALEMEPALFAQLEVRKSLDNAASAITQVFKESNYNPDTAP